VGVTKFSTRGEGLCGSAIAVWVSSVRSVLASDSVPRVKGPVSISHICAWYTEQSTSLLVAVDLCDPCPRLTYACSLRFSISSHFARHCQQNF
jgi:hypothetical protein